MAAASVVAGVLAGGGDGGMKRLRAAWSRRTKRAEQWAQAHPKLDAWSRLAVGWWIAGMVLTLVPLGHLVSVAGQLMLAVSAVELLLLSVVIRRVRRRDRAR